MEHFLRQVKHWLELVVVVADAEPDGPGALRFKRNIKGINRCVRKLHDVADGEGVAQILVSSVRMERVRTLLGLDDLLREAGDGANKARPRDSRECVVRLGWVVHYQHIVVGKGTAAEVERSVLDEVAVEGGLAPCTHHRTLHLDQFGQHIHLLDARFDPARGTFLSELFVTAHSIYETFDLLQRIGHRISGVVFLLPPDIAKRLIKKFDSYLCKRWLNDWVEPVGHPGWKLF